MQVNTPKYIHTQTTTVISASPCTLHTVVLPVTNGGAITFRGANGGATYFILPIATVADSYQFDIACTLGLEVVTASGDTLTINAGA